MKVTAISRTREEKERDLARYEWLMEFVEHCSPGAIPIEWQQKLIREVNRLSMELR